LSLHATALSKLVGRLALRCGKKYSLPPEGVH